MKIRNTRERAIFAGVITILSLLGSLTVTSMLSPTGLSPQALVPSIGVPLCVAPVASFWAARKLQRVYELNQELARIIAHDDLTGLLKRHAFLERFASEEAPGNGAVLVLQIDGFRHLNDTHGFAVGDQLLVMVARVLKQQTAQGGCAARLGNTEFALFLPISQERVVMRMAEEIRRLVAQKTLRADQGALGCTLSVGFEMRTADEPIEAVLRRADQALADAKRTGRNRVRQYQHLALV